MGAWGHGSFENDTACDWLLELEESEDLSIIGLALDRVLDPAAGYLEEPVGSEALAAAEIVAGLRGRPRPALPEEAECWLRGKPVPPDELVGRALDAIAAVRESSELRDLWEESESFTDWIRTLDELETRLA